MDKAYNLWQKIASFLCSSEHEDVEKQINSTGMMMID